MDDETPKRGPGGTAGGLGEFFMGLVMAVAGAYLLTSQVTVTTAYWRVWGMPAFGLTLVPLIFGIGFLFFDGKSMLGWILTIGGSVIIFAGIIMNLDIYFNHTSLYNLIIMLILLVGGIGLVARSLRTH